MSIRACRYCGSSSSSYWMPPATSPPISATRSTTGPSDRSAAAISSAGSGCPHHRDTDGSARIACSRSASPGRPGRRVTGRPSSTGRADGVGCPAFSLTGAASAQVLLDLVVEVGGQRPLLGDGQVGAQMPGAGGADDRAGQVWMGEREAQDELQPRHAVEQVVQAGGLPAPLAFAPGQPQRPLAPVLVLGGAAPGRSAPDQGAGAGLRRGGNEALV